MGYLVMQMLLLLVLAVALGLVLGWLVFRWRRRVVSDSAWAEIERRRAEAQEQLEAARREHSANTVELERVRADHGRLYEERARLVTELAAIRPGRPTSATGGAAAVAEETPDAGVARPEVSPWHGQATPTRDGDELARLREEAARVPVLEAELARLLGEREDPGRTVS